MVENPTVCSCVSFALVYSNFDIRFSGYKERIAIQSLTGHHRCLTTDLQLPSCVYHNVRYEEGPTPIHLLLCYTRHALAQFPQFLLLLLIERPTSITIFSSIPVWGAGVHCNGSPFEV